MARKPRVRIHRTIKPETAKLLSKLSEHLDLTEGQTLDRAVAALAVAESFGGEHLRLSISRQAVR